MTPGDGFEQSSLIDLSEVVHQRSRLAILAVLYELGQADFGLIRRTTGLTDGNLSRHLQILEAAGVVRIEKSFVDRRPRTVVELSEAGLAAFESELKVLGELVAATRVGVKGRRASRAERDQPGGDVDNGPSVSPA